MAQQVDDDGLQAAGQHLDAARCWVAVDDGRIVGTTASPAHTIALPGRRTAPCAGMTVVPVAPAPRRLGVVSGPVMRSFPDCAKGPELLAALFASDGGIYGRYGF